MQLYVYWFYNTCMQFYTIYMYTRYTCSQTIDNTVQTSYTTCNLYLHPFIHIHAGLLLKDHNAVRSYYATCNLYVYAFTVKTSSYNFCGQRTPAFYDRNSTHGWLCTEKFLWWALTCQRWPVTTRFWTCTEPFTCTCTWVWGHSRGLCKLGTTFVQALNSKDVRYQCVYSCKSIVTV